MSPASKDTATPYDDPVRSGDKDSQSPDTSELEASLQALTEERDQLLDELERAQDETHEYRLERDQLREDLDRANEAPSNGDDVPEGATPEQEKLQKELSRLRAELKTVTDERDALLAGDATDADAPANAELNELRTELEERTKELQHVRKEFEAAEAAVMEQEDEILALEKKVDELTARESDTESSTSAGESSEPFEAELIALRADFDANLRLEKESAAERIADLEAKHEKELEKQKGKLLAQNKRTVTRLKNQLESMQERMEKAKRYQDTVVKLAAREVADARRITELIVTRGMTFKEAKKAVARANQSRDEDMPRTDRDIRRQMAEDDLWETPITA